MRVREVQNDLFTHDQLSIEALHDHVTAAMVNGRNNGSFYNYCLSTWPLSHGHAKPLYYTTMNNNLSER